jgi:hypothetical protein
MLKERETETSIVVICPREITRCVFTRGFNDVGKNEIIYTSDIQLVQQ